MSLEVKNNAMEIRKLTFDMFLILSIPLNDQLLIAIDLLLVEPIHYPQIEKRTYLKSYPDFQFLEGLLSNGFPVY